MEPDDFARLLGPRLGREDGAELLDQFVRSFYH